MSSLRETARMLDETDDNLVETAAAYEALMASGEATVDDLVLLALVYWRAADSGIAAARRIPEEFERYARGRLEEVLAEALRRDPTNCEARFWEMYCKSIWYSQYQPEEIFALLDAPGHRCEGPFATMERMIFGQRSELPAAKAIVAQPNLRKTSKGRSLASQLSGAIRRMEHD